MMAEKLWPHPPDMSWISVWVMVRAARREVVRDSGVTVGVGSGLDMGRGWKGRAEGGVGGGWWDCCCGEVGGVFCWVGGAEDEEDERVVDVLERGRVNEGRVLG